MLNEKTWVTSCPAAFQFQPQNVFRKNRQHHLLDKIVNRKPIEVNCFQLIKCLKI